mmetsp:Transcript_45849/g.118966  ORF Transcript_45849/g.118966 Transcript_45849/m.118966 type:complete len:241 (+) Transcript_45849:893-1615(+)
MFGNVVHLYPHLDTAPVLPLRFLCEQRPNFYRDVCSVTVFLPLNRMPSVFQVNNGASDARVRKRQILHVHHAHLEPAFLWKLYVALLNPIKLGRVSRKLCHIPELHVVFTTQLILDIGVREAGALRVDCDCLHQIDADSDTAGQMLLEMLRESLVVEGERIEILVKFEGLLQLVHVSGVDLRLFIHPSEISLLMLSFLLLLVPTVDKLVTTLHEAITTTRFKIPIQRTLFSVLLNDVMIS